MRVYLVHNPRAGTGFHEEQRLRRVIEGAGHEVKRLDPEGGSIPAGDGIIVVAGGDGTVGRVARQYCEAGLPLTIFPLGTANNIAMSLGIRDEPRAFKEGGGEETALSLARIRGGGRERLVVEGVGCGLLAPLLTADKPAGWRGAASNRLGADLRGRVRALLDKLERCEPRGYQLRVDGIDRSGRYLMVEILNIARIGPGLELAPGKDPASGMLEVVLVGEEGREKLRGYLGTVLEGREARFDFAGTSGRRIELRCRGRDLHIDDSAGRGGGEALFEIEGGVRRIRILK